MNQRAFIIQIVGMVLFVAANPTVAEMYKWVEPDGSIVYSERPPPAGTTGEVIKPPPKIDTEQAIKDLEAQKQRAEEFRDARMTRKEEEQRLAEEARVDKNNCEMARTELARVSGIPRVYKTDEQGNRVRLGEDERQERIATAQNNVDTYCN